jgi:hypothetical protein
VALPVPALNTATGTVIGKLSAQHRAVDFRDFLDETGRQVEPGLEIPVICDNLSADKAPAVQKWLLAHPRVRLHFTPNCSSWISTWNATARPFKWTKTADQIIDRICRYCSRISGPGH